MTTPRIPCKNPQCERTILPDTAQRFDGHCAPCDSEVSRQKLEKERSFYIKNPPKNKAEIEKIAPSDDIDSLGLHIFLMGLLPPLINYKRFTDHEFSEAVSTIVRENSESPREVCSEFLRLCEPLVYMTDNLKKGLTKVPRPYRELVAAFQFWGMMSSDGISSYLETADKSIDKEVDSGLRLLGHEDLGSIATESRTLYHKRRGFEDGVEDALEDRVYMTISDFDTESLGPYLVELNKFV